MIFASAKKADGVIVPGFNVLMATGVLLFHNPEKVRDKSMVIKLNVIDCKLILFWGFISSYREDGDGCFQEGTLLYLLEIINKKDQRTLKRKTRKHTYFRTVALLI